MLIQTMRRNPWSSAQDAALLAVAMLAAFLLALEYEIVNFWDQYDTEQRRIRVEEVLVLTMLLAAGIVAFSLRRLHEERRDLELRLRTEIELRDSRALALQDALTALPNLRAFRAALEAAMTSRRPGGDALAVYLLDLNGFKRVNDEEGHAAGDAVLRAIAQRFRAAARAEDMVARIGGDEFAVVARGVRSREEAGEIGQRFVVALDSPVIVGTRSYPVGVAIGVAFDAEDRVNAEELMARADLAMYSAKAAKQSALRFFVPPTAVAKRA